MHKEETHTYKAGCGLTLHITISDEGYFIRCGKSGSCNHIMWEVIAQMIADMNKEKVIKIFKGYACEKAIAGNKSCFDRIAKLLEDKEEAK